MQAAALILVLFGNGRYTTERAVFAAIFTTGVVIGVMMEEKRMLKLSKGYRAYMEKVKARYLLI